MAINYAARIKSLKQPNQVKTLNATNKPIQTMTAQVQPSQPNVSDMINQQSEDLKTSKLAAIQQAKNQALSGYNEAINKAGTQYNPMKDQVSVNAANQQLALKEKMGRQGLFNSNDNITEQGRINVARQTGINNINLQQGQYVDSLRRSIADAEAKASSDSVEATSGIDAQRLAQLIAQANADKSFDYQKSRDTVTDTRYDDQFNYQKLRDTVGDKRYADEFAYKQQRDTIGDTGYTANGQQTVQGRAAEASIQGQNISNQTAATQLSYLPQQLRTQIEGAGLQNEYQRMVNAGYPAEQAARLTLMSVQTEGQKLQNQSQVTQNQYQGQLLQNQVQSGQLANQNQATANSYQADQIRAALEAQKLQNQNQTTANKYQGQILNGQVTSQNLQNAYQQLVNMGYPAEQAAKLAQVRASTEGQNLNNDAQKLQNQYLPQQLENQVQGQKLQNTSQELQNAYQTLVNNGYSDEQAAKLASIYANIRQGDAQTAISQQNANTSAANLEWDKNPNNPANIAKINQLKQQQNQNKKNKAAQQVDASKADIMNYYYSMDPQQAISEITASGFKKSFISDLRNDGFSADDALSFYNKLLKDLKGDNGD